MMTNQQNGITSYCCLRNACISYAYSSASALGLRHTVSAGLAQLQEAVNSRLEYQASLA